MRRIAGSNLDRLSEIGSTALVLSAELSCIRSMELLIDAGVDIDHQDKSLRTILMHSAQLGKFEVANFLISAGA